MSCFIILGLFGKGEREPDQSGNATCSSLGLNQMSKTTGVIAPLNVFKHL